MSRQPEIAISILTGQLVATAAVSDGSALESLRADYEDVRLTRPSDTRDLRVYSALARFHARREDWAGAEPHYRRAIAALAAVAAALGDPADRVRFLGCQSALVGEVRRCLQVLGKAENEEALLRPLTIAPSSGGSTERDLRYRRWGIRLSLTNFVLATLALGIVLPSIERFPLSLALVTVLFAFAALPGTLYLILDAAAGRLVPALRQGRGMLILMLSCLPWIVAVGLLLARLLGRIQQDHG